MSRLYFYTMIAMGFAFAGFWFPWCRNAAAFFAGVVCEIAIPARRQVQS